MDEDDVTFLKGVLKDDTAPVHCRARVGSLAVLCLNAAHRKPEALKICRRVLNLTISDEERACLTVGNKTAGEEFDSCYLEIKAQLEKWDQEIYIIPPDSSHPSLTPDQHALAYRVIVSMRKIPGAACDGCEEPWQPGSPKLKRCNTCSRKFYCSRDCQVYIPASR